MLDQFVQDRVTVERLRAGPFAPHLDSFLVTLSGQGYARGTLHKRLVFLDAFGQWLRRRRLALADLNEAVVVAFLAARRANGRHRNGDARTARHLLDHLRANGTIRRPEAVVDESPLAALGRQYQTYLATERGLAPGTRSQYWSVARQLLADRFGGASLRLRDLGPDDLSRFLLRHTHSDNLSHARLAVTALRSFLRFLFLNGQTEHELARAVPAVAHRGGSAPPRYLSPEQIERVVRAGDGDRPAAGRDRAILLLLGRLGLRAGEVIALELGDIDWRAGVLTVRSKGGRQDRLPLPADVGEALADYLRHHRPPCATRRVFVRALAPHRGFARPSSLGVIVRRALRRAGVQAARGGAHVLRHSLATRMLRAGASLDEVGEVLRHRAAPTTALYAKVDAHGLRSLALPWPGTGGVS